MPTTITQPDLRSLYIQLIAIGKVISNATGFIAPWTVGITPPKFVLVTNWHVLAGRNSITHKILAEETGAVPDTVRVFHTTLDPAVRVPIDYPLRDDEGLPLWHEHQG